MPGPANQYREYLEGYGGLDTDTIAATLDRRDDVRSWTALGFSNAIRLDGDAVPAVFGFNRVSAVDVTLVEGKLPAAENEVALGTRTRGRARPRGGRQGHRGRFRGCVLARARQGHRVDADRATRARVMDAAVSAILELGY